jgi:hypothetical protein
MSLPTESSSPVEGQFDAALSTTTLSSQDVAVKTPEDFVPPRLDLDLKELYAENVAAKMWRVAVRLLKEQVHPTPVHLEVCEMQKIVLTCDPSIEQRIITLSRDCSADRRRSWKICPKR